MKKISTILMGILMVCAFSIPANAALIGHAYNDTGDTSRTWDTETGLEWLDLTLTIGMSYVDAVAYGASLGFRHAIHSEVSTLYDHAGWDGVSSVYTIPNHAMATTLLNLMGDTGHAPSGYDGAAGWIDYTAVNALHFKFTRGVTYNSGMAKVDAFGIFPKATAQGNGTGNYLVRPVPEPTTLLLLGSGLIGLAGFRRKNKKT